MSYLKAVYANTALKQHIASENEIDINVTNTVTACSRTALIRR